MFPSLKRGKSGLPFGLGGLNDFTVETCLVQCLADRTPSVLFLVRFSQQESDPTPSITGLQEKLTLSCFFGGVLVSRLGVSLAGPGGGLKGTG